MDELLQVLAIFLLIPTPMSLLPHSEGETNLSVMKCGPVCLMHKQASDV